MNRFWKWGLITFLLMISISFIMMQSAWADDDDDEHYERYERYEDHDDEEYDDDHDDYEYDKEYDDDNYYDNDDNYDNYRGKQENRIITTDPNDLVETKETWHTWSRSSKSYLSYEQLPFTDEKSVQIKTSEQSVKVNAFPFQGQIYVPLKETSNALGAEFYYYEKIKAAEIIFSNQHLILKEGSKVIYENMKKTPLPQPPLVFENELYAPISVIANGLGYTVNWTNGEFNVTKE